MSPGCAVIGQGPALLLVHGWGLGPRAWDPLLPQLAERHTVHRLSLPGYAGCLHRGKGESLDDLADGVMASLAGSLTGPAIVCGWSLGAMVATVLAARHPSLVRGLILIGANARFTAGSDWPEALPEARLAAFTAALADDPLALLKQFSLLIHHGDGAARQAVRAMSACLADGLPADSDTLRSGLAALRHADLRGHLAEVRQPCLLLHGAVDPLMPLAGAKRLARLLPNATLEIFADTAHAPFAADPQRCVAHVDRFVETLR